MNAVRAISSERAGRCKHHVAVRTMLETDASVRRYFDGETDALPAFYVDRVRRDLGPFWQFLPERALRHDPNAYLKAPDAERTVRPI
jgi:hypothetical protein